MIKIRGYRIETTEIEAVLLNSNKIKQALVFVQGTGMQAKLMAVLQPMPEVRRPTLLELKEICARHLPRYMIIDAVKYIPEMPLTRNGKIDRRSLILKMSE